MDDERPKPDHTEDPREAEEGQGYPETAPAGANPDDARKREDAKKPAVRH